MGVVIGNVKCLKYDKNDSKFYGKGAFVGDTINVWLNNGTRFRGKILSFSGRDITFDASGQWCTCSLDDIKNFEVTFRGNALTQ